MLFLGECPPKKPAFTWAKEMSRMRRSMAAVVAIFDSKDTCVYVGAFDDAPFAVGALAKKHGERVVASVRHEEFPAEALENPEGRAFMRGLARDWLREASEGLDGALPVGNRDDAADWAAYDADDDPFLKGVVGDGRGDAAADDPSSLSWEALLNEEAEAAAARLQERRERLKARLDEAVQNRDEQTASKLLARLTRLDDSPDDDDDDGDEQVDPISVF